MKNLIEDILKAKIEEIVAIADMVGLKDKLVIKCRIKSGKTEKIFDIDLNINILEKNNNDEAKVTLKELEYLSKICEN